MTSHPFRIVLGAAWAAMAAGAAAAILGRVRRERRARTAGPALNVGAPGGV